MSYRLSVVRYAERFAPVKVFGFLGRGGRLVLILETRLKDDRTVET